MSAVKGQVALGGTFINCWDQAARYNILTLMLTLGFALVTLTI